jgi:hypothetical protein
MNPSASSALQLRDIHLPPAPSLWPPAPGWWLLAALSLALLIWVTVRLWQRYRLQRQRRRILQALAELDRRYGAGQDAAFASEVSILLRRLALKQFPRDEVAALTGDAWLRFLDRHGGDGQFQQGPGAVLAEAPYAPDRTIDQTALRTLAERWIEQNAGARHDH